MGSNITCHNFKAKKKQHAICSPTNLNRIISTMHQRPLLYILDEDKQISLKS